MKRAVFGISFACLLAAAVLDVAVQASSVGVVFTAGQDNFIQNTLIPQENTARCASYGLPANCTGGQVTSAGCVSAPLTAITKRNLTFRSCTIYTQDATGEAAYVSDLAAESLVQRVQILKTQDSQASCAAFGAASSAAQDAACADVGLPAGCTFCR